MDDLKQAEKDRAAYFAFKSTPVAKLYELGMTTQDIMDTLERLRPKPRKVVQPTPAPPEPKKTHEEKILAIIKSSAKKKPGPRNIQEVMERPGWMRKNLYPPAAGDRLKKMGDGVSRFTHATVKDGVGRNGLDEQDIEAYMDSELCGWETGGGFWRVFYE
jgi:hypothetical protein